MDVSNSAYALPNFQTGPDAQVSALKMIYVAQITRSGRFDSPNPDVYNAEPSISVYFATLRTLRWGLRTPQFQCWVWMGGQVEDLAGFWGGDPYRPAKIREDSEAIRILTNII